MVLGSPFKIGIPLLFNFGFTLLYCFSLGFANSYIIYRLDNHFSENKFSRKRIIINVILSFITTVFIIFLIRIFEEVIVVGRTFNDYISNEKAVNFITAIVITFIVIISFYLVHFYKAYKDNQVKEQKIIAGTASDMTSNHFLQTSLGQIANNHGTGSSSDDAWIEINEPSLPAYVMKFCTTSTCPWVEI